MQQAIISLRHFGFALLPMVVIIHTSHIKAVRFSSQADFAVRGGMYACREHIFFYHCYHPPSPGKPADLLSCWYCIPVGHTSFPTGTDGRRSSKSGRSYWRALTVDDGHYRHHFVWLRHRLAEIRRCMSPAQCYRSCCLSIRYTAEGPACLPALHAVNSVCGFHCTGLMCPEDTFGVRLMFFFRGPVRIRQPSHRHNG